MSLLSNNSLLLFTLTNIVPLTPCTDTTAATGTLSPVVGATLVNLPAFAVSMYSRLPSTHVSRPPSDNPPVVSSFCTLPNVVS